MDRERFRERGRSQRDSGKRATEGVEELRVKAGRREKSTEGNGKLWKK